MKYYHFYSNLAKKFKKREEKEQSKLYSEKSPKKKRKWKPKPKFNRNNKHPDTPQRNYHKGSFQNNHSISSNFDVSQRNGRKVIISKNKGQDGLFKNQKRNGTSKVREILPFLSFY